MTHQETDLNWNKNERCCMIRFQGTNSLWQYLMPEKNHSCQISYQSVLLFFQWIHLACQSQVCESFVNGRGREPIGWGPLLLFTFKIVLFSAVLLKQPTFFPALCLFLVICFISLLKNTVSWKNHKCNNVIITLYGELLWLTDPIRSHRSSRRQI